MRVLFLTETFWPDIGGVEVLSSRLLPALRERGHELLVVASHGDRALPDEDSFAGIPVHRLPFRRALQRRDLSAVREVAGRLGTIKREYEPELTHLNASEPVLFFQHLTWAAWPGATLVTIHLLLDEVDGADSLFARTFARADWVTAVSGWVLGKALRLLPAVAGRSSLVYYGLPVPEEAPTDVVCEPPSLLCLGRVAREKGFDVAVDALAILLRRFPSARLTIAGDGPERAALERRALSLGVDGATDFTGWIAPNAVPSLVSRATAVLVPSRWQEAFGLVALQAAQMGRPVVAARVGGLPEVVVHGETGLLFESGDATGLAEAIGRLIGDPEYVVRLGSTARARALREFAFERMVDAYDVLYRTVSRPGAR